MNEPPQSTPSPPPVSPHPFAPERISEPGGCGKPFLVGCGVLTLLLGVAALVMLFRLPQFIGWVFGQISEEIVAQLPAEVSAEERARLEQAFAGAAHAISERRARPQALTELQVHLQRVSGKLGKGTLTRPEILALTEALEAVAAKDRPGEVAGEATASDAPQPSEASPPNP